MEWNNRNLFKKNKMTYKDKFPADIFYTQERMNDDDLHGIFEIPIKPDRFGVLHGVVIA